MWTFNGVGVSRGQSWVGLNNAHHPWNWWNWSDEFKVSMGLVWVEDPAPFDNQFYWLSGVQKRLEDVEQVDENGNPVLDDKGQLIVNVGLKSTAINKLKKQAHYLLEQTRWYLDRESDTGKPVPEHVRVERQAIRDRCDEIEAEIQAASFQELVAMHSATTDDETQIHTPARVDLAGTLNLDRYVPQAVSMRQAEQEMIASGLFDAVEDKISSLTLLEQAKWRRSTILRRQDPLLTKVASFLNLTSDQLDEMFISAANRT